MDVQDVKTNFWPIVVRSERNPIGAAFEEYYRANPITPSAARMVSVQADWLVRRTVGGESLRSDFEQLLSMAACHAADAWRSSGLSYHKWIKGALEFRKRQIVEDIQQHNGRWKNTVWLDAPANEASTAVIDLLAVDGVERMVDLIDLRDFAEHLPPRFREFFELLVEGWTRSAIARFMGYSRSSFDRLVWYPFVKIARRHFHVA